jgi:hypothetical protein
MPQMQSLACGAKPHSRIKGASIAVKHYGSREAAFEAARIEIRDVVGSHLAREVSPKWPQSALFFCMQG